MLRKPPSRGAEIQYYQNSPLPPPPRSNYCGNYSLSIAYLNVIATTSNDTITMPAGTSFSTSVDTGSYSFVTISDITSSNSGGAITFRDVPVYEGTFITSTYTVDTSDISQRFVLTDDRSDITTLTVQVQNSVSDTGTTTYTKATDITQLTNSSTVYFCQEVEAGKFEIYFGDGIVSKALVDGNIVTLKYVVTNNSLKIKLELDF